MITDIQLLKENENSTYDIIIYRNVYDKRNLIYREEVEEVTVNEARYKMLMLHLTLLTLGDFSPEVEQRLLDYETASIEFANTEEGRNFISKGMH